MAKELFAKIGLEINPLKCKCTKNGEIVSFMGVKYDANRGLTIPLSK